MNERRRPGRPRSDAIDERVLQATRDALSRDGYAGLTMDGVARAAGVGRQSVYRRWSRKPLLVFDAVFGGADALRNLRRAAEDGEGVAADLANQARAFAAPGMRSLLAGIVADSLQDPQLLDELRRRYLLPRLEAVTEAVAHSRSRGEIALDLPDETIALIVVAAGFVDFVLLGSDDPEALRAQLLSLLRGGAGGAPPASPGRG